MRRVCFLALLFLALAAHRSLGQKAPAGPQSAPTSAPTDSAAAQTKPPEPQPLPNPSMSGPLQTAVPHEVEGGKLAVTGILSGIGWTEGNRIAGDPSTHWDIRNAQLFVQKTTGWWQFYLQGAAYIGAPFLSTSNTIKNIYGPSIVVDFIGWSVWADAGAPTDRGHSGLATWLLVKLRLYNAWQNGSHAALY